MSSPLPADLAGTYRHPYKVVIHRVQDAVALVVNRGRICASSKDRENAEKKARSVLRGRSMLAPRDVARVVGPDGLETWWVMRTKSTYLRGYVNVRVCPVEYTGPAFTISEKE